MDATAANIGLSRDEFVKNLSSSQLFTQSEIGRILDANRDRDVLYMAQAMLASGTITEFQLDAILQGRPGDVRIGNYDILSRLGAGGMGTVFKARHRRMKRIVALKVLSPQLCKDEGFVARFQREVETIARLGHPNIVMAYDADESESGHFLVMEFVDGRDLASFAEKNHPVPVREAVDAILQSARGLEFAHQHGIIHRDIKPANLLRDKNGIVKVTDLGLARASATDVEDAESHGLTQAGGVVGTVDYMAPEQAVDSTTVDHRVDIYSLGATLYFLLTGKPPFSGKSVMAVLLKHREAAPLSLCEVRPDVPRALDEVFQRMMAKKADDRHPSMTAVIADLEKVMSGLTRPDVPPVPQAPQMSVAIVEPSRVQSGIIRRFLEAQDIQVTTTLGTGASALAGLQSQPTDAIVCAMHLPDTTGLELAKRIRAELPDQRIGIVLISSEVDDRDSSVIGKLHKVAVVSKPFTPQQLVDALNLVTGKAVPVKVADVTMASVTIARTGSSPGASRRDRSSLRVLIVDDSSAARTHERNVLSELGFSKFTDAADGAHAIVAATADRFDLIVTDFNMPLMNGHALVSYLRQSPSTAQVPIVMVTTETSPSVLEPVRQLGVNAIFDKKFQIDGVRKLVDGLFA